jgi:hypothetical protein
MLRAEAEETCEGRGCAFRLRLHSGNPCGVLVRGGVLFSTFEAMPRRCAFCASLRFALTANPKNKAKRNFNFKMGLRTVSLPGANKI